MKTVTFTIHDLPPKKDGANSMWRKEPEMKRLKNLRREAYKHLQGALFIKRVQLEIIIYAEPQCGDLDNFISGICDGLMAVHPNTPINESDWSDVPSDVHPRKPVAFADDAIVEKIVARRESPVPTGAYRYEVTITGE